MEKKNSQHLTPLSTCDKYAIIKNLVQEWGEEEGPQIGGGVQSVSSERADTNGAANICVLKDPGILRLIYLRSCSSRKSFSPFCNQRKCDKETEDSCITLKLIIF